MECRVPDRRSGNARVSDPTVDSQGRRLSLRPQTKVGYRVAGAFMGTQPVKPSAARGASFPGR